MAHTSQTQRLALLVVALVAAAGMPMVLAMLVAPALSGDAAPAGRGFFVELGVAFGYAAMGLMALQFVLIGRFGPLSRRIGQDTLLGVHAWAGMGAAAMLLAHPIVLILADTDYAAFFDPRVNAPRALALSFAVVAITALVVTSVARRRLALKYEWWRVAHAALAAMLMLVALAHTIMVGHYTASVAVIVLMAAYTLGPLALLGWVRVIGPLKRRPWRVASVTNERERVWTVELAAEDDRAPFAFEPGQFAWVSFAKGPFHPRQHPFSFVSSAGETGSRRDRVAFTIKELGDFTRTIGAMKPGTRAWVEGPAGGFVLPASAKGAIMVAGGIGITPMMSTLRTMADRGDRRPVTLVYGNETMEKAVFAAELETLAGTLDLRTIHVPEKPPEDWDGPGGFIDKAMLEELLTKEAIEDHHAMVCGPTPMMDAVEAALLELGMATDRVRSERFEMLA